MLYVLQNEVEKVKSNDDHDGSQVAIPGNPPQLHGICLSRAAIYTGVGLLFKRRSCARDFSTATIILITRAECGSRKTKIKKFH